MGIRQFIMDLKMNLAFVFKWLIISCVLGSICGIIGALFHISVDYVTQYRIMHKNIVYLLPLGGLIIVYLYHYAHLDHERLMQRKTTID